MSLTALHPAGIGTILISPTRKAEDLPKAIHTAEEGKKREPLHTAEKLDEEKSIVMVVDQED